MDALHYFHYGQLVHHGEVKGEMRVLAKSDGISDEFINLALSTAKVPALAGTTGISWGLLRTKRGQPMVIARAEQGAAGNLSYQFIEMPADAVRELAGNFKALKAYLSDPLPDYAMLGDTLKPIDLGDISLSTEAQVETLLDLMSYARNNIKNIQPLIAAIVAGTPLIITNAPKTSAERMGMVQGLLLLLPASTRFGVTFLLHNTTDSNLSPQLSFMETPNTLDAVIYDWETATLSGKEVANDYSRFITSQMRLDLELVTRETEKLTRTAGWRFNSGDNLAKALDYASLRAKVDQSVENAMPVEAESVAKFLAEDPTLNEEQRIRYARHLINFSLALDDLSHVDAVTATMHNHKDIEEEVYRHMAKALESGRGGIIFETLVRWQDNPFSPSGTRWEQMLHKSAFSELDELISLGEDESISDFLTDLQKMGEAARPMVGRVIERALPFAERNPDIPTKLLLLAIRHLDETKLQTLMSSPRFIKPLPQDVKRLLAIITQKERAIEPNVLMRAVASMEEEVRTVALIAFAKNAYNNERIELIDERVLTELVKVYNMNPNLMDSSVASGIARAIQEKTLKTMKRPSPRLVLQLLLLSGRFDLLATTMPEQSRDIYRAEGQIEYIQSLGETFGKTRMTPENALDAVQALEQRNVAEVAMAAALLGILEGAGWHKSLQHLAVRVMKDMATRPNIIEVLPAETSLNLIRYQARQENLALLHPAAHWVGNCAARERNKSGLEVINQGYKLLASNERTKPYAIEVLRQYVRQADEKPARHVIQYYTEKVGQDLGKKLQLSYEFSNLMARMDWFVYASSLEITVDMLQNLVEAYDKPDNRPELGIMRLLVDRMRKELSIGLHKSLHEQLKQLAHNIVILGSRHERSSSTSEKFMEAVAAGKENPRSSLDVYRAAGGQLLEKKLYPFRIKDGNPQRPFGTADIAEVIDNITIASTLLNEAAKTGTNVRDLWTASGVAEEVASQTKALFGDNSNMLKQMGRDLQRLEDLIVHINKTSDTKVIEANHPKGRRLDRLELEPESPLELFRFIYGYFGGEGR
jgi:hypothetical protein